MTRCVHIYMSCACKCSCTSTFECATVSHFCSWPPRAHACHDGHNLQETPPGSVALATLSHCTHTHTVTPFHVSRSEKSVDLPVQIAQRHLEHLHKSGKSLMAAGSQPLLRDMGARRLDKVFPNSVTRACNISEVHQRNVPHPPIGWHPRFCRSTSTIQTSGLPARWLQ